MKFKRLVSYLLVFIMTITLCMPCVMAEDNVTVVIDGEVIEFDVQPQIINGRTMVPMRKIFEYMGAEVEWYDNGYTQSINSNCGNLTIGMEINDNSMWIEGKEHLLDVSPTILNGRTLVPLRAVSEAFSAQVDWINETRTVKITTKYPKNNYKPSDTFDEKHIRTSYGDYEYFDFIIDGNKLKVNGKVTNTQSPAFIIKIKDLDDYRPDDEAYIEITKGKEFFGELNLNKTHSNQIIVDIWKVTSTEEGILPDSIRTNEVFNSLNYDSLKYDAFGNEISDEERESTEKWIEDWEKEYGEKWEEDYTEDYKKKLQEWEEIERKSFFSYTSESYIVNTIEIEKQGNNYLFKKALAFDNNYEFTNKWENPVGYLDTDIAEEIINLSNNICKDVNNDYEKVLKIHDWVADNIYYNKDYYEGRTTEVTTTSLGVYNERKTVCEGYSNLTQDLILAQNIPCRKIHGLITYTPWRNETFDKQGTNHAWVQAYVDNRWVNIDTTWDSRNDYINGNMVYGGVANHYYFDISEVFFALNHKHVNIR